MTLRMQNTQVLARLAIGEKGTSKSGKLIPTKLDHFIITQPYNKDKKLAPRHASMMKWFVEKSGSQTPRIIDVVLIDHHPDEAFYSNYMNYKTSKCDCMGDGETAAQRRNSEGWSDVKCDYANCEYRWSNGVNTCKPTGKLNFIIPEAPISGGVMRFVTHSQICIGRLNAALRQMHEFRRTLKGLKVRLSVKVVSVLVGGRDTNVYIVEAAVPIPLEKLAIGEGTHPLFNYSDVLKEAIGLGLMPNQERMDDLRDSDDTDEEFQAAQAQERPKTETETETETDKDEPQVPEPQAPEVPAPAPAPADEDDEDPGF